LALERTRYEAEARGHQLVEPSHILAALMSDAQSAAAKTVASMGLKSAAVRERVLHRGLNANQSGSDD
jgi:ATP-dependent Clp protease ATP-binding subunit ClpA